MNSIITSNIASNTTSTIASSVATRSFSEVAKKVAIGAGILGLAGLGIYAITKLVKKTNAEADALEAETNRIHAETEEIAAQTEQVCEEISHMTDDAIAAARDAFNDLKEISDSINAEPADTTTEDPEIATEAEEDMLRKCEDIEVYIIDVLEAKGYMYEATKQQAFEKFLNDTIEVMAAVGYPKSELDLTNPVYKLNVYTQARMTVDVLPDINGFNQKHAAVTAELDAMQEELASDSDAVDHIEITAASTSDPEPKDEQPKRMTAAERRAAKKAEREPWTVIGSEAHANAISYIMANITENDIAMSTETEDAEGRPLSVYDRIQQCADNMVSTLWSIILGGSVREQDIHGFVSLMSDMASLTLVKDATIAKYAIEMVEDIPSWIVDTTDLMEAIENFDSNVEVVALAEGREGFGSATISAKVNFGRTLDELVEVATRKSK